EELAAGANLWRDRDLAQPALVCVAAAARVIETTFDSQRHEFGEEQFGPRAEGDPLVPPDVRIAGPCALIDGNRHDREGVVRLEQHLSGDQQAPRAVNERRRVVDRRAEIARRAGSVLDADRLEAAAPVQALIPKADAIPIAAGNNRTRRAGAALARGEVEPSSPGARRSLHVIETDVDVALDVIAIFGRHIRTGAGPIRDGTLSDLEIQIFHAPAVAAHVEGVEIVDLDVLATVIPLAGPELRVRLAREQIAAADERLSQSELIVANRSVEIRVAGGVRGIGLEHDFGVEPCLVSGPFRVD